LLTIFLRERNLIVNQSVQVGMKQSEKLKIEASEKESDLAYMGVMKKAFRAQKVEYFEENVLPALKEKFVVEMFAANSYRIRRTEGKGIIDFYPPKGRMFIHKSQKWINVAKDQVLASIEKYL